MRIYRLRPPHPRRGLPHLPMTPRLALPFDLGGDSASLPLRLALFTGNYNHIADGVSLTLNRLVAFLEENGVEVLVFGPTVEDPPMDHAGTLVPLPSVPAPGRSEYRLTTRFPKDVRERLEAFNPTLIHLATPDVGGYRALRWAKARRVPVVASYHTHFSSYLKYYGISALEGLFWQYARWFYAQCAHVYVPSRSMAAVLRSHEISEGLRLWERGVDTERFHPRFRDPAWRRSLGVGDDEVLVTFVGRLVWEKGLHVFADVADGLRAQGLPARTLVVGDGPARADLEARLPQTIFAGHLGGPALARAYASSDVFLFPSDTETFGNVTLEAMASGLPTVCADATGSSELVQHGTTGYLAPPGHAPSFLDATARLVRNADLRARMGARALDCAERCGWDAVLERLLGYYHDVLGRHYGLPASEPALLPAVP